MLQQYLIDLTLGVTLYNSNVTLTKGSEMKWSEVVKLPTGSPLMRIGGNRQAVLVDKNEITRGITVSYLDTPSLEERSSPSEFELPKAKRDGVIYQLEFHFL
ncbi:MAG: hypothetical protein EXS46_02195 [Candidatus Taylorbacteria bacterium]|nr:hypothetical protein [Candidatus Taylorbacteria bacterium]